jgi:hypothetical protein
MFNSDQVDQIQTLKDEVGRTFDKMRLEYAQASASTASIA